MTATVIDRPGLTVTISDGVLAANNFAECRHCRGSGDRWETLYSDLDAHRYGGLAWYGSRTRCPTCAGRGYFLTPKD